MRRTPIVGVAAVAVAIVLAGCAASQDDTPGTPSPATSSNSPTFPDPSQFSTPPSGVVAEHDDGSEYTISPAPVPEWDDASRRAAIDTATAAMRAFAQPDLDYDTWWNKLYPLLTQQAQQDYAYVVPANIPVREVTGNGELVDTESAYVGHVEVPTDVGTYTVLVIRADGASPWLVSRFTPPEGVH